MYQNIYQLYYENEIGIAAEGFVDNAKQFIHKAIEKIRKWWKSLITNAKRYIQNIKRGGG